MTPVEIALRISFWAVPLFIRVDPITTSGPVLATMGMSTSLASGELGALVMPTVSAPSMFARRTAASV